jgi:type IV pilus assembly protein PilB
MNSESETAPPPASVSAGGQRMMLGELLVQAKVISAEQLGEVLAAPRAPGQKIGQLLVGRGWITESQLTQTLSLQLSIPWVSLHRVDFSRQLLSRITREVAETYCLIPIFLRHVKGQGETLYVATDDPTSDKALEEVTELTGLPTRPMIASRSDIRHAIRVFYGSAPSDADRDALASTQFKAAAPTAAPPGAATRTAPPPFEAPVPPHPAPAPAPSTPPTQTAAPSEPPATQPGAPSPTDGQRTARKALNLTLLDGTTLPLPRFSPKGARGGTGSEEGGASVRELLSALRAKADGRESAQAEQLLAAVVATLTRKRLISEHELLEELKKT